MTKHAATFYAALKERDVPHQLYWHQGGHGSPPLVRTNRWFSRYLWDHQNNVENDPKAWVVREGRARRTRRRIPSAVRSGRGQGDPELQRERSRDGALT